MKRPLLLLSALLAALLWLLFNASALFSLHKRWWTVGETYEIGYPLLGIGIYWVFMLFALALLCSTAGRVVQLQVLQQLMVPVSLWCGLFALLGGRLAVQLLLPCSLLLAGIPVWDFLVEPLRLLTVTAVQALLTRFDIPALVEGYRVVLPGGVMLIADACSGLNLLLAALVLSALHAELNLYSARRKLMVIVIGVVIGIVDNWLRVFILVAIAYGSEMKSSLVYDHAIFGWWIFVASLVPFFFIARLIERGDIAPQAMASAAARSARATASPYSIVATASALAMLTGGFYLLIQRWENNPGQDLHGFSMPTAAVIETDGWLPHYSGYDNACTWRLADSGVTYEIATLTYLRQTTDKKLIYYTNRIAEEKDTRQRRKRDIGMDNAINETVIRDRDGRGRIVWWFYWIDNNVAADAVTAKFLQLRAVFSGDRSATLVAVSRLCFDADCSSEQQRAATGDGMKRLFQRLLAPQVSAGGDSKPTG
jgi:exosortase